jgi:hypothetical protein
MVTDPWVHMLQQIQPAYIELKDILENGPKIFVDLSRRGKWWCIQLQEDLPEPEWYPTVPNIGKLDERVNWVLGQLSTWADVKRMAHDMWYFKHKHDAEKFQTLYNLRWASE